MKEKSFANVGITRSLGKGSDLNSEFAKEIIFRADEKGMFKIGKSLIKQFRIDNPIELNKSNEPEEVNESLIIPEGGHSQQL